MLNTFIFGMIQPFDICLLTNYHPLRVSLDINNCFILFTGYHMGDDVISVISQVTLLYHERVSKAKTNLNFLFFLNVKNFFIFHQVFHTLIAITGYRSLKTTK